MHAPIATSAIPFPVHSKQLEFLRAPHIFRGFTGGRGAGKSKIGAYDMLKRAQSDRLYMVVSPSISSIKDTALPAFRQVADRIGRLHKINESDHRGWFIAADGRRAAISFRGGDDPDTLRGPNLGGAWMDEASLCKEESYHTLIACLRDDGAMGWLSATFTPKGKRHWTYRVFVDAADANTHLVRCRTADNPFLPPQYADIIGKRYTADKKRQELDGEFVDSEGQLISYDAMQDISCPCLWPGVPRTGQPELYLGVDIGRTTDLTCIWTWEKVGDVAWTREVWTAQGMSFRQQEDEIGKRITAKPGRVVKCKIDKGGIGYQLAENMERQYPGVADGVHLSGGNMAALANQVAVAVESKTVRIPGDRDIHDDWSMVPKPETKGGKDTLAAIERDKELGHADRFWAAALGLDGMLHAPAPVVFAAPRGYGPRR